MRDVAASLRRVVWSGAEGRLRAPWRLALTGLLVLGLATGLPLAAVAVARLGTLFSPPGRAAWVIVVAAIGLAVAVGGLLAVVGLVDRRRLADLGLARSRRFRRELAVGAAIGVGMAVVTIGLGWALGRLSVAGVLAGWTGTVAITAEHPLLNGAFWLVVFAGVSGIEELLVRGTVLVNVAEGLRGRTDDPRRAVLWGVLASAAVWGALQVVASVPLRSVATAVGLGLLLAGTVAATGRLALALGIHVAWRVALGLGFGVPVNGIDTGAAVVAVESSGPAIVTGGTFGPAGGLLGLGGLAAGVLGVAWWLRWTDALGVEGDLAVPALRGTTVETGREAGS